MLQQRQNTLHPRGFWRMGGRMGCNKELLLVVAFGIIAFALADTCLVDAIPEDQRKYLVNDGESHWSSSWKRDKTIL